jgi:hypothetical protein
MFYKIINEETKEYSAGQYVHSAEYMLLEEKHDEYTYPIDGWEWFETEEEAKTAYGITDVLQSN